jgi:hypothetical protein
MEMTEGEGILMYDDESLENDWKGEEGMGKKWAVGSES